MTRANARELAVHMIYGQSFTGVEPETALETLFAPGYYETLARQTMPGWAPPEPPPV